MTRRLISTGSEFEKIAGYSRAVVDGEWCFVSGTTGYDYDTMSMPATAEAQTANCLRTIQASLETAGFSLQDVVRVRYYVVDRQVADSVFPILGQWFGSIRPAATMVICDLIRPEMLIEIEATARSPRTDIPASD